MAKAKSPKPEMSADEKAARAAARLAEKTEAFNKLAPKRMTAALDKIALIGNLGSRAGYFYTDDQVAKMRKALTDQVNKTMDRFAPDAKDEPSGFTF